MPKFLENILRTAAASKGFSGRRADRYVYGAMNNEGVMRGNKITAKGESVQAKHTRDVKAGTLRGQHPHRNLGHYLHPKKSR